MGHRFAPRRRSIGRVGLALLATTAVAASALWVPVASAAKPTPAPPPGLLPDIRTVVPRQVQLVNAGQQEILRFSNAIANTGAGPLALRPEPPPREAELETTAVQELRDSNAIDKCGEQPKQAKECFNVVSEVVTGTFVYHPEHNHWHIGKVALFEVHKGSPTGPLVGNTTLKTSFCLLDIIKLDGTSASTSTRGFWDCFTSYQGISSGWADQYHQSTEGQQLDITGIPNADDYYLVSTSNPDRIMVESDYTNNTSWVKFSLTMSSNGNRKITELGRSPCESPGLCGDFTANRG